MDAKVIYWTGALINMAVLAGLASIGVRQARRGDYARHRRSMLGAIALVIAFIASYALKLALLGREDLSIWSAFSINTLRFHESCVLVMLIAGGMALARGRKLSRSSLLDDSADAPAPQPAVIARHRLAGRIAVAAAWLGFASAAVVLAGMYARL
jgi:uncharacterized membrane protein YozB (DUF420 family)